MSPQWRPGEDGGEEGGRAVDDGELVVAGGQGAPLLEAYEGALDDDAALVGVMDRLRVE